MNQQMRGVNTRLEVKNNFDELKDNFFSSRITQTQNIIKPINQDNLLDFHNFNPTKKDINNKKLTSKDMEVNYTDFIKNNVFENTIYKQDPKTPSNSINKEFIPLNNENNNMNNDKTKILNENKNQLEKSKIKKIKNTPQIHLNKPKLYNKPQNPLKLKENKIKMVVKPINPKQQTNHINYKVNNIQKQEYVPEIGDKRKLSNILLNVLKKWSIEVEKNVIEQYLERYNVSNNNVDTKILSQIVSEIKTLKSPKHITNMDFEKDTVETTYLISIDSIDRDITKYPNPNEFKIDFGPKSFGNDKIKGYIGRAFENVISVQLISSIFPKNIVNGNSIEDYPYIILEIDELGSNYQTTNDNGSNAFAQLTFDLDCGKYKKLISRTELEYKKNFHPRVSLNRFTLRVKTPNGQLYNFGTLPSPSSLEKTQEEEVVYEPTIQLEDPYPPINFIFKITQIQRKLDNMYLHP